MENTSKVLFAEEANPSWFVAVGESWVGPITANEVYEKVAANEFSWAHYTWKSDGPQMKRLCDVELFAAAVPGLPTRQPVVPTSPRAPQPPAFKWDARKWFLHYDEAQYGPFSPEEITRQLKSLKPKAGSIFAWRDGMAGWEKADTIAEFGSALVAPSAPTTSEKRQAPRRPLIARILMINERDSAVNVGVCRDVSIGGMQILTDQVPGPVGTRIKLNVSPAGEASAKNAIEPFATSGVIVRVLEDGRGFSFRFEGISDQARSAIENYISQSS